MSTRTGRNSNWARIRGVLAGVAVICFVGVAVAAPSTSQSYALQDEAFQERIHQQFVPSNFEAAIVGDAISPVEDIPKPDPLPVQTEEAADTSAGSESAAAPALPAYSGGGSPAEWMAAAGISEGDWGFVDYIASRESGWNPNATNPSSGACGLIQAYPCSKVPGSGYDPVANLTWANGYAQGRYGSWQQAYDFWSANHWW